MKKIIEADEVLKRQQRFYDQKRAEWPELKSVKRFWQHFGNRVIGLIGISANKQYLYIGAGDGFLTEYIAEQTGASIIGIDVSNYSIVMCIRKKGTRTQYILADAQNMPFKNDTFNGIIAPAVLHHLPDLPRALADCKRVLVGDKIIYSLDPRDYILRRCFNFILNKIISEDEIQFKQDELEEMYIKSGFEIKSNTPQYLFMPIIAPLFRRLRIEIPNSIFNFCMTVDTYFAKKKMFKSLSWVISIVATCRSDID